MRSFVVVLLVVAGFGEPMTASAHHSTANFDTSKNVTVTGTVTYFAFTNPHSYFDLDVRDEKGKVQSYKIFTVARVVMSRNDWKQGDLKPGDKVTVSGNPDRKNPTYMYLKKVTFAGGKEWDRERIF